MMLNKDNIYISNYKESDFHSLMDFWESVELGGVERGDDNSVILKTLKLGGALLLLKNLPENKIIGSSWMTVDGRRTYLHHFGVALKFQGRGYGKLLMEESMKIIKEIGLQVKLEVHKNNANAIYLYQKFNFRYLGDYEVYIIRDLHDI